MEHTVSFAIYVIKMKLSTVQFIPLKTLKNNENFTEK
jgi:hypothetical protein